MLKIIYLLYHIEPREKQRPGAQEEEEEEGEEEEEQKTQDGGKEQPQIPPEDEGFGEEEDEEPPVVKIYKQLRGVTSDSPDAVEKLTRVHAEMVKKSGDTQAHYRERIIEIM